MKVAVVINSFNLGGAEKLMYDVSEVLSKKGTEVFLLSMKKAETDFEKKVCEQLKERGIDFYTVAKPVGKGKLKSVFDIARFLRKHKIDVAHTNGQSPDFYTRLARLMYPRCKMVVTIHSAAGYSRKIEKVLSHLTDAYTAVSHKAKEYAVEKLGIGKEVSVIINGVDETRYSNDPHITKGKSIISVGRVMIQKYYNEIVSGVCSYLEKNPDARWDIVGDISQDKACYEQVEAMVPDSVRDRVVFHGAVTEPESYYKSADCFILASKYEGFGLAYVEAMLAELPVITRKVGVIPEIESKGGKTIELDVDNLTQNIEEALQLDTQQLKKNKQICIDNYSIDAVCDKYLEIYSKVLNI